MNELEQRQNEFVELFDELGEWTERFNYLISFSDHLPAACPDELLPYRIHTCQSRTYFHAWHENGIIHTIGWSNTATIRGIIYVIMQIFYNMPVSQLTSGSDIFFHQKSGLLDNLTPLRQEGLKEIIRRINVLSLNTN